VCVYVYVLRKFGSVYTMYVFRLFRSIKSGI